MTTIAFLTSRSRGRRARFLHSRRVSARLFDPFEFVSTFEVEVIIACQNAGKQSEMGNYLVRDSSVNCCCENEFDFSLSCARNSTIANDKVRSHTIVANLPTCSFKHCRPFSKRRKKPTATKGSFSSYRAVLNKEVVFTSVPSRSTKALPHLARARNAAVRVGWGEGSPRIVFMS